LNVACCVLGVECFSCSFPSGSPRRRLDRTLNPETCGLSTLEKGNIKQMNPCANAKIRTSAAVLAAVASVCALANPAPASDGTFAHYQVILDRQPFGVPPAPEQAAAAVPKPEPAFTRELRLCGITYNKTSGLRVGIVDQKTQGSYYLGIGDEQDGIMVVDADIEEEFAVIRKEGEERRLYLDGRIVSEPTAPVSLSPEAAAIVSAARRPVAPQDGRT
jgi:hypothetical protein